MRKNREHIQVSSGHRKQERLEDERFLINGQMQIVETFKNRNNAHRRQSTTKMGTTLEVEESRSHHGSPYQHQNQTGQEKATKIQSATRMHKNLKHGDDSWSYKEYKDQAIAVEQNSANKSGTKSRTVNELYLDEKRMTSDTLSPP